ncbi:MAG: helix-turn-helix domain-containing protein [Candidatus Hodarchaeales archaeon]
MTVEYYQISADKIPILANKTRWKILEIIAEEDEVYAKQIAEILGMSESKVHYHLNLLRKAGLIVSVGEKSVKYGRVKYLKLLAKNFTISLTEKRVLNKNNLFGHLFKQHFSSGARFDGKIVVGAAQPHGKYDALSRDGFLVGDLCWYLGNHFPIQYASQIPNHVVTDIEYTKLHKKIKHNLILVGGPITNTLTDKLNLILKEKFDIYFFENKIVTDHEEFQDPSHAIVSLIKVENYKVLILAGVRSPGTQTAIFTIVSNYYDIMGQGEEFATVLYGKKINSLGINGVKIILRKEVKGKI